MTIKRPEPVDLQGDDDGEMRVGIEATKGYLDAAISGFPN